MIQVCILTIAGLFAAIMIKKDKPEYSTIIIFLVSFLIAIRVLGVLENVLAEMENWKQLLGNNFQYINLLLKLIGITYICDFAANLCKDAGYSALSNNIELFGKIAVMVAGLPVLKIMMEMLEEIM